MKEIGVQEFKRAFVSAYHSLERNKEHVNALNVFPVPDGDTGTNMSLTLKSAIRQLEQSDCHSIYDVAKAVSNGALMGARGNSGVILSQVFRGFARGLKDADSLNVHTFTNALKEASQTAYKAVMRPTEGTMLTVMREMAEFAEKDENNIADLDEFAKAVLKAGEISLQHTPELLPILKEANVVDAGGKGLLLLLQGALQQEEGEMPIDFTSALEDYDQKVRAQMKVSGDIEFGYCTELMIQGQNIDIDSLREKLSAEGDSHLVVGDDNRVKIHLHTNNPGYVLQEAAKLGSLHDIKIDNMREQYAQLTDAVPIVHEQKTQVEKKPKEKYGFIAVSSGDGLNGIFRDLGVNAVIHGGQTMNPSTEDILAAIQDVSAETTFVLPNNGNIVLAANQAAKLTSSNVIVVPTKTIPEGFTAMLHFDAEQDPQTNRKAMEEARETVRTAEITYAVRDTSINGKKIVKGNFIGLEGDTIHATGKDVGRVVTQLLDKTVTDDSMLITIFYGEDTTEKDAQKVLESVRKKYPDKDVELSRGGQPLYFYIFSIE